MSARAPSLAPAPALAHSRGVAHARRRRRRRGASAAAGRVRELTPAARTRSRDHAPIRIPLVINIFLVNLDYNANNVFMALHASDLEQYLMNTFPSLQPSCLETGEQLHVKYDLWYHVAHIDSEHKNMIEHADSGFQHLHILSQGVSDETIMMVRTLMMNASEASDSKAFKRVKLNKHISVRNEMATLRCLYNMGSCLMYRHHYAPTTLAAQAAQTAQAVGGAGGEAGRGGAKGRGRRQAARVTLEGSRKLLLGFMNMMSETVARTQQWTGKNMDHDASVSHVCAHA